MPETLDTEGALSRLWAKTGAGKTYHLLIYHLIDVAQSALALWDKAFSPALKDLFINQMGLSDHEVRALLAFWIGLHDIGKAAPAFQAKVSRFVEPLREISLPISKRVNTKIPHGWLTHYALGYRRSGFLEIATNLEIYQARSISRAVAGHHGSWPLPDEMRRIRLHDHGGEQWQEAREILFNTLYQLFNPVVDLPKAFLEHPQEANPFLILLSGYTSTADWIGSMEEYFPYHDQLMPLEEYMTIASNQAVHAVEELGWQQWHSTGLSLSFEELFPEYQPNQLQQVIIDSTDDVKPPALIIVEGQTGMGKTEAAYYVSDHWLQQLRAQGLYIAMPTQATSNQMFDRTKEFLTQRYVDFPIDTRLLHSQAKWRLAESAPSNLGDEPSDEEDRLVYRWFEPKKRGLLAPFAVGTVDQALLSILLTRHYFVRLFALAGKVIIFDEVHAYDFYMNELFELLLKWLSRIGSSVIILSATLSDSTRRSLVAAYTGQLVDSIPESNSYPRVTGVSEGGHYHEWVIPRETVAQREIRLSWLEPTHLIEALTDRLAEGGCAVVLGNTVSRAREIYREIVHAGVFGEDEILLFHARYPFAWRKQIEEKVLNLFGKEGERPRRFILVSTQVVEQSLDLDFDVMFTELPPVDFLIQRVGRLHRHDHMQCHGRPRPQGLSIPEVIILQEGAELSEGLPVFERGSKYIYGRFLLLSTWLALQGHDCLRLPDDTLRLIEIVYGDGWYELPYQEQLQYEYKKLENQNKKDRIEADIRTILNPDEVGLLIQKNPSLSEDEPLEHKRFQAMTRLIAPGVSVICIHETINGFSLESDAPYLVWLDESPDYQQIGLLLQFSVDVRDQRILDALLNASSHQLPPAWQEIKALQYHRLAVFRDGLCRVEGTGFQLYLSRETGMEIVEG